MNHTCENCGTRVLIPEEWLILGINKRIKCKICNKRYNLLLEGLDVKETIVKRSEKSGTVFLETSINSQTAYHVAIKNELTGQLIGMKELHPKKKYIFGRDLKSIIKFDSGSEPVVIASNIDSAISRVHFALTINSKIVIEDLESLNGTYIINENQKEKLKKNDKLVMSLEDKIKIGKHIIISIE